MSTEKIVCEYCGERFISEVDLEAHKFNNKYCSPAPSNPPSIIGEEDDNTLTDRHKSLQGLIAYELIQVIKNKNEITVDDVSDVSEEIQKHITLMESVLFPASLPPNKEQEGGLRWVKASERLPKMEKPVFLKLDGETMGMGNFYEEDKCYMLYVQRNGGHDEFEKHWNSTMKVEWLEELPPTPDTSK